MATIISLLATPMTIILCGLVVWHWGPPAVRAFREGDAGAQDWLILGIAIGFAGAMLDNLYWGVAWAFDYLGHPWRDATFRNGSLANIFFRQGAGIAAGFCHVVSAYMLARRGLALRLGSLAIFIGAVTLTFALLLFGVIVFPEDPAHASLAFAQIAIPGLYATFAAQVMWHVAREPSLKMSAVWTYGRIGAVFFICGMAGYASHVVSASVHHVNVFMLAAHYIVIALMLRVVWKGRDAQRIVKAMRGDA